MNARALIAVLLWMWLPLTAAHGQEAPAAANQTLSPYFALDGTPDGVETFTLEATKVTANVSGVIADVTVQQTYRNGGTLPIKARYVFPASTRAAVHAMQFQLGDRRVVAKIKEREQASAEFKRAAESGKTASLLEQDRPNVFSMSVANIMPGDRVLVQLSYSELLVPTDGTYQFVYPTVVGPRYANGENRGPTAHDDFVASPYLHQGDAPDTRFALDVNLSTGVPLADVRCATHRITVAQENASLAHVTLTQGRGFAGNRDFILDYRLAGAQIQTGLLLWKGEQENHFLFMVQPPARVETAQIPAREYVFVLDVSGSMYGFPLDTAKQLIRRLIGRLRPTDTFNVLLFSGDAQLMADRSVPATAANVQRAIALIDAQRGGGGTELEAALRQVAALPRTEHVSRSVVVLTDGYIAQERGAFDLITQHVGSTNVFAFGIGSSVNRYLIEGVARAGQGEPFIVTTPDEAAAAAERFGRYIESPLLTEVAVRFDGFDAYDVEPAQQADLFAQRPIVVFGKWRGAAKGTITVSGHNAAGPYLATLPVTELAARAENAALPQLWARARIARLSDFGSDGDAEAVRQVTQLGLRYSLLTQHTSFIAVLERIRNPSGQATDVDQPLPLPVGVSELAVGGDYAAGAEPELPLLLGMLLLGAIVVSWRRARSTARNS